MQVDVGQLKNEIARCYAVANMGSWSQIINGDLARKERGEDCDMEYTETEMRAFNNLRGRTL